MNRLHKSLYTSIVCLLCLQLFLLFFSSSVFSILLSLKNWVFWIIVTHLLMIIFLFLRKQDFVIIVPDVRKLEKINLANILTLFRMSSAPTLHYLLYATGAQNKLLLPLVIFAIIISLSDMFDGLLARRNQITVIGKYLDPMADYYILLAVSFAMFSIDLLDQWLLLFLIARLVLQGVFASIVITRKKIAMHATILGKIMICSVFLLYNFSILLLFDSLQGMISRYIAVMEIVVVILVIASSIERIYIFSRGTYSHHTAVQGMDRKGRARHHSP